MVHVIAVSSTITVCEVDNVATPLIFCLTLFTLFVVAFTVVYLFMLDTCISDAGCTCCVFVYQNSKDCGGLREYDAR